MQDVIHKDKLSNGISVFLRTADIGKSLINLVLTVKTGSLDDGVQKGISHFLEHCNMIFDKYRGIESKNSFFVNAYTDYHSTNYCFKFSSSGILSEIFDIIQNIVLGYYLKEDKIDEIRHDIMIEYKEKSLNHEFRILNNYFKNTTFESYIPIGEPLIISKLSYKDIWKHFMRYYYSENMGISVVSNLDSELLISKIKELNFISKYSNINRIEHSINFYNSLYIQQDESNVNFFRILDRRIDLKQNNIELFIKHNFICDFSLDSIELALNCDNVKYKISRNGCKRFTISTIYDLLYFTASRSCNEYDRILNTIFQYVHNYINENFYKLLSLYKLMLNDMGYYIGMHEKINHLINHYVYNVPIYTYTLEYDILTEYLNVVKPIDIKNFIYIIFNASGGKI